MLLTAGHALGASKRNLFAPWGLDVHQSALVLSVASLLWLAVCWAVERRGAMPERRIPSKSGRDLLLAFASVAAAQALSSLHATDPRVAWAHTSTSVLGMVAMLLVLQPMRGGVQSLVAGLSRQGKAVLGGHAALLLVGWLLFLAAARHAWPFATASHQHTGGLPRFYGFGVNPFYAAVTFLTCAGLVREREVGRVGRIVLSAIVASTLSFVSLLVPLIWLDCSRLRKGVRTTLKIGVVLCALSALYLHPLRVDWGTGSFPLGALHEGYGRNANASEAMPVWSQPYIPEVPSLTAHATAYFYLAKRALSCFADHPFIGVGPGNFAEQCPVQIMDTYGTWRRHTPAHNQYLGGLAEEGLLGLFAWGFLAMVLGRRLSVSRWQRSLLTVYLVSGMACPIFEQIPFWIWLGVLLRDPDHVSEVNS